MVQQEVFKAGTIYISRGRWYVYGKAFLYNNSLNYKMMIIGM